MLRRTIKIAAAVSAGFLLGMPAYAVNYLQIPARHDSSYVATLENDSAANSLELEQLSVPANKAKENNAAIADSDVNLVQFQPVKRGDILAVFDTTMGTIQIKLFPEQAPKAVKNFTELSRTGYYNGVSFHRVINDFMIQGGDPTGTGRGCQSIYSKGKDDPGYFEDEFSLDMWNFRGALSMANAGPNTNSSQFFIVQSDTVDPMTLQQMGNISYPAKVVKKYGEIGGTPHLDWQYTVFGMVIEGMNVVDAIAATGTDSSDSPLQPVLINKITITEFGSQTDNPSTGR